MIAARVITLAAILALALFVGFVVDRAIQFRQQDVTSRLSARSRRVVSRRINARWSGRGMANPYAGPIPTPTAGRALATGDVLALIREATAELESSTADLRAAAGGVR